MFNNLLFLSQGVQIALFVLLIGLIMVFMKMTTFEKRLKSMEVNMSNYLSKEEYMETFNNMWYVKQQGGTVSPYEEDMIDSS